MTRRTWDDLADGVRYAIEAQCGAIGHVTNAPTGSASDFAGTFHTQDGLVFVKAIHEDSAAAWMLANEARVNPWLPDLAPRLLWQLQPGAWLVNGYEHIDGHHANLAPGSPDLALVATALDQLAECDTESWRIPMQPIERRWAGYTSKTPDVAGTALVHTDPVAANLLVTDHTVRIVDWAWPGQGAPWIDTAFLVIRLIDAGNTPTEAEQWAATVTAWAKADPDAVTGFAATIAAMWLQQARERPAPHRERLAAVAASWDRHRGAAR